MAAALARSSTQVVLSSYVLNELRRATVPMNALVKCALCTNMPREPQAGSSILSLSAPMHEST